MAKRTRDWAWRRLAESATGQLRQANWRKPDLMVNKHGQTVRSHVAHPTTPALDRFNAKTLRHFNGYDHCVVWYGGATFRVDDDTVTTPARFYYEAVKGEKLAEGETLRRNCKTPRCLSHKKKVCTLTSKRPSL